VHDLSTSSRPE